MIDEGKEMDLAHTRAQVVTPVLHRQARGPLRARGLDRLGGGAVDDGQESIALLPRRWHTLVKELAETQLHHHPNLVPLLLGIPPRVTVRGVSQYVSGLINQRPDKLVDHVEQQIVASCPTRRNTVENVRVTVRLGAVQREET